MSCESDGQELIVERIRSLIRRMLKKLDRFSTTRAGICKLRIRLSLDQSWIEISEYGFSHKRRCPTTGERSENGLAHYSHTSELLCRLR
uniref:G-protein alpha subunit n=1 Tax=Parascaris univalens TaxID=6257 RepID=A0A915CIX1_PARUN